MDSLGLLGFLLLLSILSRALNNLDALIVLARRVLSLSVGATVNPGHALVLRLRNLLDVVGVDELLDYLLIRRAHRNTLPSVDSVDQAVKVIAATFRQHVTVLRSFHKM